jgi:hypothetical protein
VTDGQRALRLYGTGGRVEQDGLAESLELRDEPPSVGLVVAPLQPSPG